MKITNLKIGVRLSGAFALILSLSILMTGIGISQLQNVVAVTGQMNEAAHKERLSLKWLQGIATNSVRTFAKARTNNPEDEKYFQEAIAAQSA